MARTSDVGWELGMEDLACILKHLAQSVGETLYQAETLIKEKQLGHTTESSRQKPVKQEQKLAELTKLKQELAELTKLVKLKQELAELAKLKQELAKLEQRAEEQAEKASMLEALIEAKRTAINLSAGPSAMGDERKSDDRWSKLLEEEYRQWIFQSWQRQPYSTTARHNQAARPGLYAVYGVFKSEDLVKPLIQRWEYILSIADALPSWAVERSREREFGHFIYVGYAGESGVRRRLMSHGKNRHFKAFVDAGISVDLLTWTIPQDFYSNDHINLRRCEALLIRHLCPLLCSPSTWAHGTWRYDTHRDSRA